MLEPLMTKLNSKRIVLASGSPRRREILQAMGLKFEVVPSTFEETLDKKLFSHPKHYVRENSRRKALEVFERLSKESQPDLVIGADTVVVLQNKILEKPKSEEDAFHMLASLSGQTHDVYSGVTLVQPGNKDNGSPPSVHQFDEGTEVSFAPLTDAVIKSYIATGEPMDKAGAYGIQGLAGSMVQGTKGDYYNVVGFPLHHFCCIMTKLYSSGG